MDDGDVLEGDRNFDSQLLHSCYSVGVSLRQGDSVQFCCDELSNKREDMGETFMGRFWMLLPNR